MAFSWLVAHLFSGTEAVICVRFFVIIYKSYFLMEKNDEHYCFKTISLLDRMKTPQLIVLQSLEDGKPCKKTLMKLLGCVRTVYFQFSASTSQKYELQLVYPPPLVAQAG